MHLNGLELKSEQFERVVGGEPTYAGRNDLSAAAAA
jgi:hypothetical protein